jgi:hypothetical protein
MYTSPKLLRHGSFREMTQAGLWGSSDHIFFLSIVPPLPPVNNPPPSGGGGGPTTTVVGSR